MHVRRSLVPATRIFPPTVNFTVGGNIRVAGTRLRASWLPNSTAMAKQVVFVIGATGSIGAATVTELALANVEKYGDKLDIRAGVRNPEKADKLKALPGVSVVQAEMGPDKNLVETFKGVHTLFINTPGATNRRPLTVATAEAAKSAGVKHLVVVSGVSTGPMHEELTKSSNLTHQWIEIESAIKQLGVPYTFLRLPWFMDNFFGLAGEIKSKSSISSPADPTKPLTCIVVKDAGSAGAEVLADPSKHVNKAYSMISDCISYGDLAAAFSEALGREIKYVRMSYEDARKMFLGMGLQEWQVNIFVDFYKAVNSGMLAVTGSDADDIANITGKKPTDLKTWVSMVAGAFK